MFIFKSDVFTKKKHSKLEKTLMQKEKRYEKNNFNFINLICIL